MGKTLTYRVRRDTRGVRALACAIALAILSADAGAQSPENAESPPGAASEPTIDTVTVEARRRRELLERQLSEFVTEITVPVRHESLARWQVPICPLVAGLPFEEGKLVFQRVSQIASDAGLPLGSPTCNPNLFIVMTREPEALLGEWWDAQPRLFNKDRGVAGIKRTIRTPAPVRVFYNACSVPSELAKTFAVRVTHQCGAPAIPGTRLTRSTVRVLYLVIVVVDKTETEDLALQPLTDYIAMNALAHLRRDPDVGNAPTILALFDETVRPPPQALSPWDRGFLKSLYDTDSSGVLHRSEIKERMKRDLAR